MGWGWGGGRGGGTGIDINTYNEIILYNEIMTAASTYNLYIGQHN